MSDLENISSQEEFETNVLKSSIPVIVDFWAPWCGPCKMLGPILEELAPVYKQKVSFMKVNVDDHQDLAAKYGVRGIPTIIMFKDGEPISQKVGLLSKSQLTAFVDSNL